VTRLLTLLAIIRRAVGIAYEDNYWPGGAVRRWVWSPWRIEVLRVRLRAWPGYTDARRMDLPISAARLVLLTLALSLVLSVGWRLLVLWSMRDVSTAVIWGKR
jgi:hypothetical protein